MWWADCHRDGGGEPDTVWMGRERNEAMRIKEHFEEDGYQVLVFGP